jgi:2'-5' RNA ligase
VRLFVALFPPEDVRDELRLRLREAGPVRLVPVERWHLTMAFLGEIPSERVPGIEQAVGAAAGGGPIRLRLAGGGSFGSAAWAGVDGDLAALARLRAGLRQSLAITEDRPFTPHLTVSYHGNPETQRVLRDHLGTYWTATHVELVHSADGYTTLRKWGL